VKRALSSARVAYRRYRAAKNSSRAYRVVRYTLFAGVATYVLLLSFPQALFAHEVGYKNFQVYSREPLTPQLHEVLDKAEAKLTASQINDPQLKTKVFLTNSTRFYAFLSMYVGGNSFGKGYPLLPTSNVFINKASVEQDLVFRDAPENNARSLSGVIAHETAHLLVRKKLGYWGNFMLPNWKKEGYAEYVAGGSTLSYEAGVKLWKQNPRDSTGYQYFKYYQLVKYLLDHDKLTLDELFQRDFDLPALEEKVLRSL